MVQLRKGKRFLSGPSSEPREDEIRETMLAPKHASATRRSFKFTFRQWEAIESCKKKGDVSKYALLKDLWLVHGKSIRRN